MKYRRIVFVIGCVAALAFWLTHTFGRPMRYEIPGDYKGWMLVQFENSNCPPLPSHGVFRIVSVPASRRVCTSDHHPDRWTYHKFEYVYSNGARKSLRLNDHGKPGTQVWLIGYRPDAKTDEIFVGDEYAMDHSGPPPDSSLRSK